GRLRPGGGLLGRDRRMPGSLAAGQVLRLSFEEQPLVEQALEFVASGRVVDRYGSAGNFDVVEGDFQASGFAGEFAAGSPLIVIELVPILRRQQFDRFPTQRERKYILAAVQVALGSEREGLADSELGWFGGRRVVRWRREWGSRLRTRLLPRPAAQGRLILRCWRVCPVHEN